MATTLVTGGTASQATEYAAQQISLGDRVVILHEFPDDSASDVPKGAFAVFDIAEGGLSSEEVAEIYGARRIIDLNRGKTVQSPPQHLY